MIKSKFTRIAFLLHLSLLYSSPQWQKKNLEGGYKKKMYPECSWYASDVKKSFLLSGVRWDKGVVKSRTRVRWRRRRQWLWDGLISLKAEEGLGHCWGLIIGVIAHVHTEKALRSYPAEDAHFLANQPSVIWPLSACIDPGWLVSGH